MFLHLPIESSFSRTGMGHSPYPDRVDPYGTRPIWGGIRAQAWFLVAKTTFWKMHATTIMITIESNIFVPNNSTSSCVWLSNFATLHHHPHPRSGPLKAEHAEALCAWLSHYPLRCENSVPVSTSFAVVYWMSLMCLPFVHIIYGESRF